MTTDPVLLYIRESARRSGILKRVVLYGSRARGAHHERSDYDIALEFLPAAQEGQISRFMLDLVENSPTLLKLDLVVLGEQLNPALRASIDRDGVLV